MKDRPILLETHDLTKSFGGLVAVNRINFELAEGELRAIIGPNGAGKTTFLNLVCGILQPEKGRIFFRGKDITNEPPHIRSRIGIGYTFQLTSIFPQLSVFDNVTLPVQARTLSKLEYLGSLSDDRVKSKVESILKQVRLQEYAMAPANDLAHGDQRKLEIAIALALEPHLLILDEPTQGMSIKEVDETVDLIHEISKEKTILIIEHNMEVVLELAQRITVFDKGTVIAEGTGSEISQDQNVINSYIGTR
jgi:branched-chain amino acid transport system ATP-binding protein